MFQWYNVPMIQFGNSIYKEKNECSSNKNNWAEIAIEVTEVGANGKTDEEKR